jgi:RimJ/RimL family protein N-acetyltransferase
MPTIDLPIVLPRLTLRAYRLDDLGPLTDMNARPEVARYLYTDVLSAEESRTLLERKMSETTFGAQDEKLSLAVARTEDDAFVGGVILRMVDEANRGAELGFIFHPDFHGHGYAGEAARALLDLAFGPLGLHRVIGQCDARNEASARLMKRLGMRQEAHFISNEFVKGEWCDELDFAVLEDEWPPRPAVRAL